MRCAPYGGGAAWGKALILSLVAAADRHLRFTDLGIDPVAIPIRLGSFAFDIKWYSLAYIAGILIGYWYMLKLIAQPGAPMARRHADDLVFYATIGIIAGGRLGYVIFYAPEMFLSPLKIIRLWDGGMSFHGGAIGTSIGIILFARAHKLDWLRVHDYLSCCVPFGLFFGRIANFVNGELWGKPSQVAWAIVFPRTPADVPRHPSQLYEAGLEGILLFALLWLAFWRTKARYQPGRLTGLFMGGYGVARFIVEFYREPDAQFYDPNNAFYGLYDVLLVKSGVHMGQWLCVPMILGGAYLIATANGRRQRVESIAGQQSVA